MLFNRSVIRSLSTMFSSKNSISSVLIGSSQFIRENIIVYPAKAILIKHTVKSKVSILLEIIHTHCVQQKKQTLCAIECKYDIKTLLRSLCFLLLLRFGLCAGNGTGRWHYEFSFYLDSVSDKLRHCRQPHSILVQVKTDLHLLPKSWCCSLICNFCACFDEAHRPTSHRKRWHTRREVTDDRLRLIKYSGSCIFHSDFSGPKRDCRCVTWMCTRLWT